MSGPEGKPESLRDAYGSELATLGAEDPDLVVLDAGRSSSTGTHAFGRRFPERFFDVGEMDPTMVTIATGLSLSGRTVVASSFAVFAAGQAYNMVRQSVCFNRANVKLVATHGGLQAGGDGGTYQILEDIGLMRALPGLTVVVPCDAPSTRAAVRAVTRFEGPAYVRLSLEELPAVTDGSFQIGRAPELRPGSDLTLVAVGALVARALEVAEELHRVGVEARVLDFASIKPFDEKALLKAARETGAILTFEEHSLLTGLGALVAAATSENYPVPVRRIGVPDLFGESGDPKLLREKLGLSKERALEEAWELLRGRGKVN